MKPIRINKDAVFYNTMLLASASVLLQLLGFVYRIVLSRTIGSEGMGMFSLVMPTYSILQSLVLSGLVLAVQKICAQQLALGDFGGIRSAVKVALGLFSVLFSIVGSVYFCCSKSIATYLLGDSRVALALIFMVPCLFLTGFENVFKACFYGTKKVIQPITSELIEQLVRIGSVFLCFYLFCPTTSAQAVQAIILAMILSEIVSSTTMLVFYRRYFGNRALAPMRVSMADTKQKHILTRLLVLAVPVSLSGTFNTLIHSVNTVLIPQRLVVAGLSWQEAVSQFGILSGMTMPLLMVPSAFIQPLSTVLFPKISADAALQNTKDLKRKTAKAFHLTSMISMPFVFLVIFYGEMIATLVYHQPKAGMFIVPLCICAVFSFFQAIANMVLNAVGYQKRVGVSIIALSLLQLPFTWFLIGDARYMLEGFVVGNLVCGAIGVILSFYWAVKKTNLRVMWVNWFYTPILCSAVAGFLSNLLFTMCGAICPFGVALSIALVAFVLIYIVSLRACGMQFVGYFKSIMDHQ